MTTCCLRIKSARRKLIRFALLVTSSLLVGCAAFYVIGDRLQLSVGSFPSHDDVISCYGDCRTTTTTKPGDVTANSSTEITSSNTSSAAANFDESIRRRREHLLDVCRQLCDERDVTMTSDRRRLASCRLDDEFSPSVTSSKRFVHAINVDRLHGVLFCAVPKVASSTLKTAVAAMTGRIKSASTRPVRFWHVHNQEFLHRVGLTSLSDFLAAEFNVDDRSLLTSADWNNLVRLERLRSFVVVRHPIDRVVSAFRDKLEAPVNRWTEFFHDRFGRAIVERYRRPRLDSRAVDRQKHNVTFAEFVRFLTDPDLTRDEKLNAHWMPYSELCHPCAVQYDYVLPLESFRTEFRQLFEALYGPENFSETTRDWLLRMRRNANLNLTTTGDVTSRYLSLLTSSERRDLFKLYENDFRMFGYDLKLTVDAF